MDDTTVLLARAQFALTIMFHYIYPPLSIGLGVFLVIVEGIYLKTRDPLWRQVARYWTKVFALTFAVGVATGLVMEFEFGTNWAKYSRFVGDIFGSLLASEGIFAFFLESGFLAVLLFGWDKVGPKMHYFATVMVCLGAHFSAVWIVVANSWMHTPAGFHLVDGPFGMRAEVTDFWMMVFNPSSVVRLAHVLIGAWLCGAFLVVSICAWFMLKRRHEAFTRATFSVAIVFACVASYLQLAAGHFSSDAVAKNQPVKFAAMEGHFVSGTPADLHIIGWMDKDHVGHGITIPGGTSFLLHLDFKAPVTGYNSVPPADRPPEQIVFQTYHLMIGIGFTLIGLSSLVVFLWWKGRLERYRWLLWVLVFSVLGPQIANQFGWIAAEVGRQPWIVQGLMRTSDAVSPNVSAGQIIFSLILFTSIYLVLFVTFIYVLNAKIQHGPEPEDTTGPLLKLPQKITDAFGGKRIDG